MHIVKQNATYHTNEVKCFLECDATMNNRGYKLFHELMTWHEARDRCNSIDCILLTSSINIYTFFQECDATLNNRCYKLIHELMTWYEARDKCTADGGSLLWY